jgi:hypothetical protein
MVAEMNIWKKIAERLKGPKPKDVYIEMTDKERVQYFDSKLAEIPPEVLDQAIEYLSAVIPDHVKSEIALAIQQEGLNKWVTPYHFGWGMSIRNHLRNMGLKDDLLPEKNWDDYYHQIVEIVVGARPMPKEKK